MPVFAYKARTAEGKLIKGKLNSTAQATVLKTLEQRGVYPIEVTPGRGAPRLFSVFRKKKKIKHEETMLFTRQLEAMLNAGISLTGCLDALAEQAESEELRDTLDAARKDIEGGSTFTETLERHPELFSPIYVNMVRAGEESGTLSEMVARIGDLLEYDAETRSRVKQATFYPMIVVGELFLATLIVIRFVFPRFKSLFSSHGAALPLPTRVMIAVSDVAENYWIHGIVLCGVAALAARWYVRTEDGQRSFHRLVLAVPIFGELILKILMSRFSRVMSSLLRSGIPLLRALAIVERTIDNVVIQNEIRTMREGIRRGGGLTDAIKNRGVFPPPVTKMLEVGERSGALEEMLERVSAFYDGQVDYKIKNLTTVIEPIMLVVLGVSVLFIALAVFLPMWNLMGALTGAG